MKDKLGKFIVFVVLLSCVLFLIPVSDIRAAKKVKMSKKSVTIYVGSAKTLKLSGANKSDIEWTVSDSKVAKVTSAGKVKGIKKGEVVVKAVYKGKEYACKVTVKDPYLNYTNADMNPGETLEFTLTGTTAKKWSSSDDKVATVSKGKVTAVGKGSADITVTGKNKKKYTLKVNVYEIVEVVPKIAFDLSQTYTGGALSAGSTIPNSALSASGYGIGPQDIDFGRSIPDEYRKELWRGDDTVMRFVGTAPIEADEEFTKEDGYFWVKAVFLRELIDRQTYVDENGQEALVITKEDLKNAKLGTEELVLRYSDDVFRSPLDGKEPDKDGFLTFSLTCGGREFNNCKFKVETVKDERTYYISVYTAAYIKLPIPSTTELFLTTASLDDMLRDNTGVDAVTSYGVWSPYRFSPIVCGFRTFQTYNDATRTNTSITEWNKELCEILGLEFTGTEDSWD